jgi:glycerophosphoryl diester phosphodiesterase
MFDKTIRILYRKRAGYFSTIFTLIALMALVAPAVLVAPAFASGNQIKGRPVPLLIAHRGASGYAPEHTLAAYELAIQQGADFVEQDLQLTKDGVLICLHDPDLARTTNVAEIFPDRATERDPEGRGAPRRGWFAVDFTLAEIKRLDAGSWFNRANPFAARKAYAGLTIPTLEEAIKLIGQRAGFYIEMKYYPFYKSLGLDMAERLVSVLNAHGLGNPERRRRVLVQSFSKASLLRLKEVAPTIARIQLLPMEDAGRGEETAKITISLARELSGYATGVGPSKTMIGGPGDVATLRMAGLIVHPYTFRGSTLAAMRRPLEEVQSNGSTVRQNIIEEIQRFIQYGIDGGFTDYPELWKQAVATFNYSRQRK